MTAISLQIDQLSPENIQLIQAYLERSAAAKASVEDFDGWLERINNLKDLTTDCLIRMHGQLIALGYLKFELSGRSVGLRYQVSPKGKQALERALRLAAEAATDEDEDTSGMQDLPTPPASEISGEAA